MLDNKKRVKLICIILTLFAVGVPGFEPGTLPISNRDALPDIDKKNGEQKFLSTLL